MSNREGNWDIYTIGVDGQNLQRLTDDEGSDGLPVWSPDGQQIAFVTNRDGTWAMWAMTATGEQRRQLFSLNGSIDGVVQVDTAHAFGWLEERIVWSR
jgi:Tol biopolymer transport system component